MVDVASIFRDIWLVIYSIIAVDKEQCGGEWTLPNFPGKYLSVTSKHWVG